MRTPTVETRRRLPRLVIRAGAVSALLAQSLPALAQGSPAAPGVDEIAVTGRWEDPVGASLSASSGVFGQQEISERPILRTGELLEFVPGLILTQHSGSGKSNQMFLRGFNLDHGTDFATWVDGMPVNMRTHGHGQGYTDVNFLIEELVERVEFVKGPVDARIGDFSSAGAALMRTSRGLDEGFVKATVGEFGFRRALAANTFAVGTGELTAGAEARLYDGPWDNINEDLEAYKALLRYTAETRGGDIWNVAFMGYDASWNSADQIPRRAVEQGLISDLGSLDRTVGGTTSRYSLSGGWTRDLGDSRWQARGYVIDYELDLLSNFTYFLDDPVNGDQFQQLDDRTIYGGDLSFSMGDAVQQGQMQQTFGVEFRYDDIAEVALNRTVAGEFLATTRQDSVDQASVGFYYENRYAWTDKLRSVLAVRYDYFDFDVDSNLAANSGSGNAGQISPKLSLIYTVSESAELYANAGIGMHSNDARGVTITQDPVSGDPAERVDPLVESRGAEAGGRVFLTDRLNLSAAVWYLELDSELLFVGDAGATEALGPSQRYGIEIPIYYQTDYWKFDLELSFTHSEFSDTGEEIPGSLDRVVAAGAYFDYPAGWYGAARVRHFGERPLIEDGSAKSDPTTVVNTMLGYRWDDDRWDVRGELLNVFDSNDDDITYFYESRLRTPFAPSGTLEPAAVADQHFRRVEPRQLRVTLSYRF
ncbi:MAG: TonB-dependent receptor [Gammaproteobacteria bacterium]|jgi:outer membrane receptor protein involved in Fe transport|nr:TonB-dependent receptor [Gammaproteobacteria bacterium]